MKCCVLLIMSFKNTTSLFFLCGGQPQSAMNVNTVGGKHLSVGTFYPRPGNTLHKALYLKHSIHRDFGALNRFTLLLSQLFSSRVANWHKFSIQ